MLSMPLHFLYPYAKRWTWWPQAWLGKCNEGDLGAYEFKSCVSEIGLSNGWSFLVGWFTLAGNASTHPQIRGGILMYLAMVW